MQKINKVVILGGGSAGWMAASMLKKALPHLAITLIESDEIGAIGVGEASIPPLTLFNQALGINESEFMSQTQATIKLGIQFENWNNLGDSYMHAFGDLGKDLALTPFHHYWLKAKQTPQQLWNFSFNYQASKLGRYNLVENIPNTELSGLVHAYHFDAGLYAKYLSQFAQAQGVKRIEGKVEQSKVCPNTGNITSLILNNQDEIKGDFFIDCSGFRALLIEKALGTGYEDWSHFLPCDSAFAVPSERLEQTTPYTRSIAHDVGWQWQIPLQHRIGNGLVYCSRYLSDEDAKSILMNNLPAKALAEPRKISFRVGRRLKQWNKNCVALGLASGFLEPLESTSIHLIQSGILRLIKLFPSTVESTHLQQEFNQQSEYEFKHIRDFIILHYRLNQKDTPFWRYCQHMDIPSSLKHKIALFKESAQFSVKQEDLFQQAAWLQVMIGQGMVPSSYHPAADELSKQELNTFLNDLSNIYSHCANALPSHDAFLQHYCAATL